MRRPGDTESDPPGGRAAERLREFLRKRTPPDAPSPNIEEEEDKDAGKEKNQNSASRNQEHNSDRTKGSNQ